MACGSCLPISAVRPYQSATAVLGADRHQARGRLPAHPRIHLFVWCSLSEGRNLRLSDHADIEYGVLPGLPRRPLAKICQAGHSIGSRWRPQPPLWRPRASRQCLATVPAARFARAQPKGEFWDKIREKIFKNYALISIDAVRTKLKHAILYIERNPKLVQSITSFPYIVKSL